MLQPPPVIRGRLFIVRIQSQGVFFQLPTHPDSGSFHAVPFFLGIRQYSCEKMSCSTQKFLAAGHIGSSQIHPKLGKPRQRPLAQGAHPSNKVRKRSGIFLPERCCLCIFGLIGYRRRGCRNRNRRRGRRRHSVPGGHPTKRRLHSASDIRRCTTSCRWRRHRR